MELQTRTTFGRRGEMRGTGAVPARVAMQSPRPSDILQATESGVPLTELAARLYGNPSQKQAAAPISSGKVEGIVPWSWPAALLAGLVTSFLLAGVTLYDLQHAGTSIPPQIAELLGESVTTKLGPAILLQSLVTGARTTASVVFLVHVALRPFKIIHPIAYGIVGATLSGGWVELGLPLGFHDILPAILGGFAAGFFYRTFAGAKSSTAV